MALKGTGSELESAVQKLREAARRDGLIDEAAQVVRSDTRQLASDFHHGVITIDTPRTQGASGQINEVERAALSGTEIRRASGFCTVIASSLDGEPLGRSQRILLTVVGDAANTDEVAIIDRHELANVPSKGRFHPSKYTFNANRAGRKPMVAEPVAATLAIRREAGAKALRCQGLDTAGRATGQVPVRLDGQWAEISLDARHRSIYFLLSSE
ncbi:MAG: hypothetical protein FJ278_18575 [Planctomycetes bacterium]|nr:hypothetical protein [Planctomycetota bacterium]